MSGWYKVVEILLMLLYFYIESLRKQNATIAALVILNHPLRNNVHFNNHRLRWKQMINKLFITSLFLLYFSNAHASNECRDEITKSQVSGYSAIALFCLDSSIKEMNEKYRKEINTLRDRVHSLEKKIGAEKLNNNE